MEIEAPGEAPSKYNPRMAYGMRTGRVSARIRAIASVAMLLAFTPHCGGEGEDEGSGGGQASDSAETSSGGTGGTPDEMDPSTGGSSTGGSSTDGTGGTAAGGGVSGECSHALRGDPCTEGDSCTWSDPEECLQGQCICDGGNYLCGTHTTADCNTDDAACPSAVDTSCGDPCEGEIKGCLCQCGGGPDYASCSCSGGSWQCSSTSCK